MPSRNNVIFRRELLSVTHCKSPSNKSHFSRKDMFHRARSGAGRGVILIRLNTTSSSSPVKEVSFFDKAKKWTKITSPLLTFGVVSSFVIGNLAIRHYTEAVFPAYVQFLRDNYGFEDEDDEERSRVAAIEANNSKPVRASIVFDNGEQLEDITLDGDTSYSRAISGLELQHGSSISSITFIDSEESNEHMHVKEGADYTPTQDTLATNSVGGVGMKAYASSHWDPLPSLPTSVCQDPSKALLSELNTASVLRKYDNLMPLSSMEREKVKEVQVAMRERNKNRNNSYVFGVRREQSTLEAEKEFAKHEALQTISRLEQQLIQCNKDMQIGSRDMDTVTAEIQKTKEEISTLQRKYVNRFYYF